MLSDLSSTVLIAAVALILVGVWFFVTGRRAASGQASPKGIFALRTAVLRASPEAWESGHRAASPFLERYGRLVLTTSVLVMAGALVFDWLGAVLYLLAVALVVLGFVVCVRKAHAAARRVTSGSA